MTETIPSAPTLLPEERELFEELLAQEAGRFNVFPLSAAQRRLWFLEQLAPGSPLYVIPAALRIRGPLRVDLLERGIRRVVERHEILRTLFVAVDGEPVQVISPDARVDLSVVDLTDSEAPDEAADRLVRAAVRRPFDLGRGPLLRALLARVGDAEHRLLIALHHIVADGWSCGLLAREIAEAYAALLGGGEEPRPALPIQYADFAAWQNEWLRGEALDELLGYWTGRLRDLPPLELPTDRPRSRERRSARGLQLPARLDGGIAGAAARLGRAEGTTRFAVLLAAYQAVLGRWSGQDDFGVGAPVAGRDRSEVEELIGCFVNTLVHRAELAGADTFRSLVRRVGAATLEALDHAGLPFERLVDALEVERSLDRTPLFQVLLVLQNTPRVDAELAGTRVEMAPVDTGTAKFDLSLILDDGEDGMAGVLEADADLFDPATAGRILGHLETFLRNALAAPDLPLRELPLMREEERAAVLAAGRGDDLPTPAAPVHERFAAHARETPDAVALVHEGRRWSYGAIEREARRLARALLARGAGPERPVAVCLPRTAEAVTALLAVLASGAAYLPLDPEHPAERLVATLADAGVRLLVTTGELVRVLVEEGYAGEALRPDAGPETIASRSSDSSRIPVDPDRAAYVVYTSGSTGRPKGVVVSHGNLGAYAAAVETRLGLGPGASYATVSTLATDLGNTGIYAALTSGGTLHVVSGERARDAAALAEIFEREPVDCLKIVPSHLGAVLTAERPERLLPERCLVLGGEVASARLVAQVRSLAPGCRVLNHYGPSETTVGVAAGLLDRPDDGAVPPIGRPLPGARLRVLDRHGSPQPVGVPGALFVGGGTVSRGYLGRPALTAERFVPDPFAGRPGRRQYDTGDRVRLLPDGAFRFEGRLDQQVKIRGYRVEPGEVEAVLESHEAVARAAVVAREGGRRLEAYYMWRGERGPGPDELRAFAARRLPDPMVPTVFVRLDELPLTASGKVDRRALPAAPGPSPEPSDGAAPRTPVEELLAGIWGEVLERPAVGAHDDFFSLGGHSLLATRLVSRIRQALGVELPVRQLFETPTVAGLAVALEGAGPATGPPLVPVDRDGDPPLSFAQERLWFLHQVDPASPTYNLPYHVRLLGDLDPGALERSLGRIVDRHEVLRARFPEERGRPVQRVEDRVEAVLPRIDLAGLPSGRREPEARRVAAAEARRGFDLSRAPLLRPLLVSLGDGESWLLLTLHHIVSDAWARGVLTRELASGYRALRDGRAPELPELPIQYGDFAVWQRRRLQGEALERQLVFWRESLAGLPTLELPTDHPRPALQGFRGASVSFDLGAELSRRLAALSRRYEVTLFMTLLAGFEVLLHRYAGQDDLAVGAPIANRTRTEVEGLIGVFINTLVLRGDLSGAPSFAELLRRVRRNALAAYAHQDLPFERLVEDLQPARDLSRSPLFQVMLMFQNAPAAAWDVPGLACEPLDVDAGSTKFDLTLVVEEADGRLRGFLEYDRDLFAAATAERMLDHLRNLLEGAVSDPHRSVARLPLMGEEERWQVLFGPGGSRRTESPAACVHELVAERAARMPDAAALVLEGAVLSYGELVRRAGELAGRLRGLGVGPGTRVGVYLDRSAELVPTLLAVLGAGGAYVPLDPAYPRERLAWIAEDAGLVLVLSRDRLRDGLPAEVPVLPVDGPVPDLPPPAGGARQPTPDDLAYVIYTSGSTGRPKGVMVPHRTVAAFLAAMDEAVGAEPPQTWLAVTSISFDISVLELFWTLSRGATVVLQGEPPRSLADGTGPVADAAAGSAVDLGLFYFASDSSVAPEHRYDLLLEGARFADRNGFTAIWTPERHFHDFGGLYPNPSVISAALAMTTERISLRAGSVVLPLHDPVRVAEEWSVVDNLSRGRVAVSFASGWHPDDFVLAPDRYERRKELMAEEIETVRRLWRGEGVTLRGGAGREVEVRIRPTPVQDELPVWVTAGGSPETFGLAGRLRAGLLTHLTGQTVEELESKIALYRQAWREAGDGAGDGCVTLMLHTFVGHDLDEVRETVRKPLSEYLRSSVGLWRNLARSVGRDVESERLTPEEEEAILAHGFERYFATSGLLGTPRECLAQLDRLRAAGVDEIACLIDFGVDAGRVMAGLETLADVRRRHREGAGAAAARSREPEATPIPVRIERERVTHLQCTPSMARMLVADAEGRDALAGLAVLAVGGEALPAPLARELGRRVPGRVINMYGPTETTVWSTTWPVEGDEDPVPIGTPVPGTEVHVLDRRGEPVPHGVPGEVLIAGGGVVRGYLGRPALTAERFVPDALGPEMGSDPGRAPGGRLYRTGDRARRRPDGVLEFLGRLDHQVKVRGHRIEPGEVEAVLRRHPEVADAVVVAHESRPGDVRLAAYVVPRDGHPSARPRVPEERQRELFAEHTRYVLPGGMPVAVLSELQASLAYDEIFARRTYLQRGIRLRPGDRVLDVGANVGFFTLFASLECPDLEIHCFEPIPPTFATLSANVELYGLNATLHPVGISRREEEAELTFYPRMSGLSGRYSEPERDRAATRRIMVDGLRESGRSEPDPEEIDRLLEEQFRSESHRCRLRPLSDIIAEQGFEAIDFLKIDVERAEVDVLEGIADEDWPRIRQVVLEVDGRENLERVTAILGERGYHLAVDRAFAGDDVEVSYVYAARAEGIVEEGEGRALPSARPAGEPAGGLTVGALRAHLSERLPDFMVPSLYTRLDELPRTPNGKVDRRALPPPEEAGLRGDAPYQAPETDLQERIAAVWREALGVERVGLRDNFFELGGTSLLLVEVRSRLRDVVGREVSLVDLFRAPTVAALADHLDGGPEAEEETESGLGGARSRARRRRAMLEARTARKDGRG